MKVIEDKKTTWSLKHDCSSCKSTLEIKGEDVFTETYCYFDEDHTTYYRTICIACKQAIDLPKSKLPTWVQSEALRRKRPT